MEHQGRPQAFRSFLFGVFGFAIAAAVLGAVLFLWPDLVATEPAQPNESGSTSSTSVQAAQIEAMQVVIDHLRYLLAGLALGLTGIVVIQTVFQARHDRVQHQGVEQVSSVMGVVKDTLVTRLDAEIAARDRAETLQVTIDTIKQELDLATRRRQVQDRIIAGEREAIEAHADRLASHTSRHQFRDRLMELDDLARQFDNFKNQYEPMEEPAREFSARVLYIRGIAALYANDPERAARWLTEVTQQTVGNELAATVSRRVANAFYYLGVTHSNFDNLPAAADSFSAAISRIPEGGDYLTRVVYAEALAMGGGEQTQRALVAAETIVDDINRQATARALRPAEHRLRSRAILIQANASILTGDETTVGPVVDQLLRPLLTEDPDYYYAVMTLAQTQPRPESAALYKAAYDAMVHSNHLFVVREARTKILLHMVAALCLRHGMDDVRHSEEHLDLARGLLFKLPRIDSVPSTVFSVLTKRNESAATIGQHLHAIHSRTVLIPGQLSANPT